MNERKTMVLVFAGPNGSGKSTTTEMIKKVGQYINADEIVKSTGCDNLTAAQMAEKMRNSCIDNNKDFTFETVMSTPRNLELLKRAKEQGYFIKSIFVLTDSPQVNVNRVKNRVKLGGHDVPKDKIISRYYRSLDLLPELIKVSDICNVVDNTLKPFRIFSKKNGTFRLWENELFDAERISKITAVSQFNERHTISEKPVFETPYLIEVNSKEQIDALRNADIKLDVPRTKDGRILVYIDKKDAVKAKEIVRDSSKLIR